MRILSRTIFREILTSAMLGIVLFTFVLFLQQVSRLFALLVRSSASAGTVGYLFALILPYVLTFSIPVGVLVGVLMALSRMSSDGEITAMRAAGVPSRTVIYPVLLFAFFGMALTAAATLWITPLSNRIRSNLITTLDASQITADIQPRVFDESFPNRILYVGDVIPGPVTRWRKVFLADVTAPAEREKNGHESGEEPRVTVASEAIAMPDPAQNRIRISFENGSTHEAGKNITEYYNISFPKGDQLLEARKHEEVKRTLGFTEMDTGPLSRAAKDSVEARIQLHQRFALPPACIFLALIGLSLGVSSRKAGKSSAFVLSVAIAFLYWMGLISLIGLAKQGTLPVGLALWLPNIVVGAFGLFSFARLETPGDRDPVAEIRTWFQGVVQSVRGSLPVATPAVMPTSTKMRFPLLPQLIDAYVLSTFLFYFTLLLASFVLMTQVFNFFELLSDVVRNKIPMSTVAKYLFFLAPKLIYDSTPISVMVAVLVTFGILSKSNEVIAMKACGVSLYRLAVPVLVAACCLSGGLFAFDHYYIPEANVVQDALRNQIKNRPVQTYLRPDRKWIFGEGSRIYYYKYFEPNEGVMVGVSVYELDPATFRLQKHISAERARWEPTLKTWVFQNGWAREFQNGRDVNMISFPQQTATFAELKESPNWFLKEDLQEKQMNFLQLGNYIRELRQSGLDTVHLQVQFYKKFSVPLFALIMALLSVPFAFMAGNRGAMAGIGVSFIIAIAYWSISALFEQVGNLNQLPAALAAWSPNAVFSLAGLYFFARMRT